MRHKIPTSAPPTPTVLVEACVQTPASAEVAARAGADRLELCAALELGGVTPGAGLLRAVRRRVSLPIHVLVRPRAGDFRYQPAEVEAMVEDVREARRAGADGIVAGALDPSGSVDRETCARLVSAAGPLPVTFHRAFDAIRDQKAGLEVLIGLGFARVLTSGGAPTAQDGMAQLASLVGQAGGRIAILAGGGVRAPGIRELVSSTAVREVHLGPRAGPRGELDRAELEAVLAALGRPVSRRN